MNFVMKNVMKNGRKERFNMSEVEKMYKNAGVGYLMYVVDTFPPVEYPQIDFTAEKQLELIKWIACNKINECKNIDFGEVLAELINSFWQSLTEEEKQQIKEILE